MKKVKRISLFILSTMLVATTVLTGCGKKYSNQSAKKSTNTLTIGFTSDFGTLDVQKTTDSYTVPLNIFDRLVETETVKGKPQQVPGLAESWKVSDDGLVYTFKLRKGVKFQNGETLKADDVLYTFDRMLDPKTKALNTDFLDMIAGADDRMNGKADSTSGLKVIDDYTIQITLSKPFAPFIANLATPACSIYNRKATTEAGDKFGIDPALTIGTGPFKTKSWKVNDNLVLVANPDYYKGKPALAEIDMKIVPDVNTQRMLFETGKLDVLDCDNVTSQIPYFEGSAKWKNNIVTGQRVGLDYYCLNEKIKPFDDVKVRKALQLAIDRKTLLNKLYNGKGKVENGIMPYGLMGYNSKLSQIPYDQKKAKELLKEAGYPDGFTMTISQISDHPSMLKINQAVQSMLSEVGIKVQINQMDESSYYALRKQGQMQCYENNWSADYNDPDNFFYTLFSAKNTVTRSFNYSNEDSFAKLEDARKMTNQNDRIKLYQELEKTIAQDDAAWIPLFSQQHLFVVQSYVKNFKVAWNGWSDMKYYGITVQ